MGVFSCDRCGKCCVSLGPSITIERQLNDRDYYCRCRIGNTLFLAHVDPGYRDQISDELAAEGSGQIGREKKTCIFLRKNLEGDGTRCAIFPTRPQVCREFRCYRMLVYDTSGHLSGKVIGAGEISTSDETLARIWKEKIASIPHAHPKGSNDPAWVKKVAGILAAQGYRGDAVE
jgi:uncharacterized protein